MTSKKLKFLTLTFFLTMTMVIVNAQSVKIVSDVKTEAQAAANAAMIELTENKDKYIIKTTRERADSMVVLSTTWHTLNELYHQARTNVNGFKYESALYQQIYAKFMDVAVKIPIALEKTLNNPLSSLRTYKDVLCIQASVMDMAKKYKDIVTNGKVVNPLKVGQNISKCPKCGGRNIKKIDTGNPSVPHIYVCQHCGWNTDSSVIDEDPEEDSGDGYNFLSFKDRYDIADYIYRKLLAIDWRLYCIIYGANQKMTGWGVLKCIDPISYYNLLEFQRITDNSISRIKRFCKFFSSESTSSLN